MRFEIAVAPFGIDPAPSSRQHNSEAYDRTRNRVQE
jgi:hypothetical protein